MHRWRLPAFQDTSITRRVYLALVPKTCWDICGNPLGTSEAPHAILHFKNFFWKLLEQTFAKNSPKRFCQQSCQYIVDPLKWNYRLTGISLGTENQHFFKILSADVKSLCSSVCRETAYKALECVLERHSIFNIRAHKSLLIWTKIVLTALPLTTNID